MNLLKLLRKLKGSRLDEAQYELLQQAAELQAEKRALIQDANKILQENNDRIKDKVRRLEDEIRQMRRYLINQQVVTAAPAGSGKHIQEISEPIAYDTWKISSHVNNAQASLTIRPQDFKPFPAKTNYQTERGFCTEAS